MSVESVGNCPDHGQVFRISSEALMTVYCPACGCDIPATVWYGLTAGRYYEIDPPRRAA